jgi:hypothetical protein
MNLSSLLSGQKLVVSMMTLLLKIQPTNSFILRNFSSLSLQTLKMAQEKEEAVPLVSLSKTAAHFLAPDSRVAKTFSKLKMSLKKIQPPSSIPVPVSKKVKKFKPMASSRGLVVKADDS